GRRESPKGFSPASLICAALKGAATKVKPRARPRPASRFVILSGVAAPFPRPVFGRAATKPKNPSVLFRVPHLRALREGGNLWPRALRLIPVRGPGDFS